MPPARPGGRRRRRAFRGSGSISRKTARHWRNYSPAPGAATSRRILSRRSSTSPPRERLYATVHAVKQLRQTVFFSFVDGEAAVPTALRNGGTLDWMVGLRTDVRPSSEYPSDDSIARRRSRRFDRLRQRVRKLSARKDSPCYHAGSGVCTRSLRAADTPLQAARRLTDSGHPVDSTP